MLSCVEIITILIYTNILAIFEEHILLSLFIVLGLPRWIDMHDVMEAEARALFRELEGFSENLGLLLVDRSMAD